MKSPRQKNIQSKTNWFISDKLIYVGLKIEYRTQITGRDHINRYTGQMLILLSSDNRGMGMEGPTARVLFYVFNRSAQQIHTHTLQHAHIWLSLSYFFVFWQSMCSACLWGRRNSGSCVVLSWVELCCVVLLWVVLCCVALRRVDRDRHLSCFVFAFLCLCLWICLVLSSRFVSLIFFSSCRASQNRQEKKNETILIPPLPPPLPLLSKNASWRHGWI